MKFYRGDSDGGVAAAALAELAGIALGSIAGDGPDPVLVTERGDRLSSASAILRYLGDPVPWLRPETAQAAYDGAEWLNFLLTEIDYSARPLGDPRLDPAVRATLARSQQRKWGIVADHLAGRPFLTGERICVADIYLAAAMLRQGEDAGPLAPYLDRLDTRIAAATDGRTLRDILITLLKASS